MCIETEFIIPFLEALILDTIFASGRRDFGEFSVYKPDKREASATAD